MVYSDRLFDAPDLLVSCLNCVMSWGRARSGLHVGPSTGRNESCLPQTSAPSATTGGYRAQMWRAGAVSGNRGRRRASAIALFQVSLVTGDFAFLTTAGSARAVCSSYVSPKIRYNFSWFWDRCTCITARCSRRLTRLEGLGRVIAIREHTLRRCTM